jgi:hypothetical protein
MRGVDKSSNLQQVAALPFADVSETCQAATIFEHLATNHWRRSNMRSPGHSLKRALAIAIALLATSLPCSAQSPAKTRVWHGTQLVEADPASVETVETAPAPRVVESKPAEPDRLPPIHVQLQQPQIGIEALHALIAEMGNARRIDRLEQTTGAIQKQLDKQGVRQTSNVESAPAKLPESALNPQGTPNYDQAAALKVDLGRPDAQPSWTTMILTQLAAIVGSIVIVTILFFGVHLLLVRRSGGGLGSLFKIELIGTHAPSAGDVLPMAEAIPADPLPESWGEPTPNFDIGPTYEEERQMREDAERNKERALLMHIFEENQKDQEEIRDLPEDAETENEVDEVAHSQPATAN